MKRQPRTRLLMTCALGAALALSFSNLPAGAAKDHRICGPKRAETLAKSSRARIFRRRGSPSDSYRRTTLGCLFSRRGDAIPLDEPANSNLALPPFALKGRYVAYNNHITDDIPSSYAVVVMSLRSGGFKHITAALADHRAASATDLALKRDGSVAWIACPEGIPTQTCDPEQIAEVGFQVWKNDRAGVRQLDRGMEIDPKSLRRRGSHISWLNGGVRRTAKLR
jgi:hypothetical protein